MKPPVLVCFNLHGDRANHIRLLAMRFTIRVRLVKPEEHGQTLAALCGLEAPEDAPPATAPVTEEMLVLGNFTPELINAFLGGFRQAKIPPVELKAVLTDTNARWNAATLCAQLSEERDALAAARGASPIL